MAKVKLTHPLLVHGAIQAAGTIVEMDDKLAEHFGDVQGLPKVKAPVEEIPVETPKKETKTKANSED